MLQYSVTPSVRWLLISLVVCIACADGARRDSLRVQSAELAELADGAVDAQDGADGGSEPDLDGGADPDMDGGDDPCTPLQTTDTTCDGIDDDCNGAADEDYLAQRTSCGVGACAASGIASCVSGAVQDSCAPGTPAAEDATCDGVDDDCNGAADEDHGIFCTGTAVTTCEQGMQVFAACSDDDVCNGDEDCRAGACTPGVPLETDDQNDCTVDACDAETGVVHTTAAVGTRCELTGVCDGSQCVTPRSCLEWLELDPGSGDGSYRIDVDGEGAEAAIDVYCDMTTAGGGWQLITVTEPERVLVGSGYCQSPAESPACAGQLHPLQASPRSEILVQDRDNGAWLRYGGFSGGAESALRYFTRELVLDMGTSCNHAGHVCNDTTRDPGLVVRETSGFALEHVTPLHQWWRHGGWWVGGQPNAAFDAGRVHSSTYSGPEQPAASRTGLRARPLLLASSIDVGTGTQAIFHRDDGCADGVQHGAETGIDCGGSCAGCATGAECSTHGDCASGQCQSGICEDPFASCIDILVADPLAVSGPYVIDVDGSGAVDAFSVYCDMTTDGGGWQLISSVRSDIEQVIVGSGICTDPSPSVNCHGQAHPLQVGSSTEVMVRVPTSGDFVVYDGFSGTSTSALRYFTRELGLGSGSTCTAPHACANTSRDPALRARTSGYPLLYNAPLVQWWRLGGWWIGANPGAAVAGRVHASSYNGTTDLRWRDDPDAGSGLQAGGHQLLMFRTLP